MQGDAVKISRIAQNLLLNALKYTNAGGTTVSWKTLENDRWQFVVADTGPGQDWPVPEKRADNRGKALACLLSGNCATF